jgi:hypothetical protein
MKIVLDIAALISAIAWPLVVVVVLLTYGKAIPELIGAIGRGIKKVEFAGVSIELAMATPAASQWQGVPKSLDLRRSATSVEFPDPTDTNLTDSSALAFVAQLTEGGTGDYAEVDLGRGGEWLTSRLYIMANLFPRTRGVKVFVFLETVGEVRKRFVGWANPAQLRWALARRYPWLETAYADAYSTVLKYSQVVSSEGRLGSPGFRSDPGPSLHLLHQFLASIQSPPQPSPVLSPGSPAIGASGAPPEWVVVSPESNTFEHAQWITGELLEDLLGPDLTVSAVTDPGAATQGANLAGAILGQPGDFVAVTRSDGRLEYVVKRQELADLLARSSPAA